MTFFAACNNEEFLPEPLTETNLETNIEETQTLSITVDMPGDENPPTRVTLDRDGKDIVLRWQEGDRLQFAFVQGNDKYKNFIYSLTQISPDGKTVTFDIPFPSTFDANEPFDLYGVYSNYNNSGIDQSNPTNVILTNNPGSINNTLQQVENRGDVMLYFESKNIDLNTPVTVEFKHLGSLFSVSINNITADLSIPNYAEITNVRLVGVDNDGVVLENGNWAYNNGPGGQIFDLLTEEFQNISSAGNYISFATAGSTWAIGETTTLWGWYPPIPNQPWPALKLQMTRDDGSVILESTNFKPARATAPEAGRSYYFYASFNLDNTISFATPFSLD